MDSFWFKRANFTRMFLESIKGSPLKKISRSLKEIAINISRIRIRKVFLNELFNKSTSEHCDSQRGFFQNRASTNAHHRSAYPFLLLKIVTRFITRAKKSVDLSARRGLRRAAAASLNRSRVAGTCMSRSVASAPPVRPARPVAASPLLTQLYRMHCKKRTEWGRKKQWGVPPIFLPPEGAT